MRSACLPLPSPPGLWSGLPRHLALVLDGCREWAATRGRPPGEAWGPPARAALLVAEECLRRGLRRLTLVPPLDEGRELALAIAGDFATGHARLSALGVRILLTGRPGLLPDELRRILDGPTDGTRMVVVLAIAYDGRDELVQACRRLSHRVAEGRQRPERIDADALAGALGSGHCPLGAGEVDLLVRCAGRQRFSGILPWQTAYAELVVRPECWPDFGLDGLDACLGEYSLRERRFGRIDLA